MILFLLAVFLGVCVIGPLWRRGWGWSLFWLGVSAAACAWLFHFSPQRERQNRAAYLARVFDCAVETGPPLLESGISHLLMRGRYTFSVYELPPGVRRRFEKVDERLLAEGAGPPGEEPAWERELWREAPAPKGDDLQSYTEGLLEAHYIALRSPRRSHCEEMVAALGRRGTYYTRAHKISGGGYVYDELFLVDLPGNRLYLAAYAK